MPRLARLFVAVTTAAGVAVTTLAIAPTADAATHKTAKLPAPVTAQFFGLHYGATGAPGVAAPRVGAGALRLWDSGTSWRDIESAPGRYDFARLDRAVSQARAVGAKPMLVLGQTPVWHSSKPEQASYYGPGAAAMPRNLPAFRNYVKAVAKRYKGRIDAYEVWNEPSAGFFTGTPAQMVTLTREVRAAVKSVDPRALVVAASSPVRRPTQRTWLNAYYAAGAGRYVDVVNVHLYPDHTGTPETALSLLAQVKATLARNRVSKPIWNSEVNYGLPTGGSGRAARPIADTIAAGYVARTYLLDAAAGVSRVHWYTWSNSSIFGINMTTPSGTPTAAAKAFTVTRGWMVGARVVGCAPSKTGVYTCTLKYNRGYGKVMWAAKRSAAMRTPANTTAVLTLDGRTLKSRPGQRLVLGPQPVLIRTSR
jgi:hypothetical protein